MSLKSFHIFFIVVSTLTTFCFGVWSIAGYWSDSEAGGLILGVLSLLAAGLLVLYGVKFFRKLKQLVPTIGDQNAK